MNEEKRKNLLFILIAILVVMYLFRHSTEKFEQEFRHKCGEVFYNKNPTANMMPNMCPNECYIHPLGFDPKKNKFL